MSGPIGLAAKTLGRHPARAALAVAGVAFVGALLFDMLLLSRGLVLSFRDMVEEIGFEVRVTATKAIPGAGPRLTDVSDLVRDLERLDESKSVVPMVFAASELLLPDQSRRPAITYGTLVGGEHPWNLLEGEGLTLDAASGQGPYPIVVNRAIAELLDASPGDTLALRGAGGGFSPLPPVTLRISGIAEFAYDRSGDLTAVTTLETLERIGSVPDAESADLVMISSREGVTPDQLLEAVSGARPDVFGYTNEDLIRRFRTTDFSYFRQISFVLTVITSFFTFLLVTTILTVSVNQRLAEIAMLRALGFARPRVAATLIAEALLIVAAGALLALPLGSILAVWLETILRSMPLIPDKLRFFVFESRSVVGLFALLGATGLLASLYPVALVWRLRISETLRREAES